MTPVSRDADIGIYIHIPFCSHICPYCDFNTYAGQDALIPRYVEALKSDLARQAVDFPGRRVSSIFFGGGTPSLLPAEMVDEVLAVARAKYEVITDAEISLESNPNSVDEKYFSNLRAAGVNRISLGVQTTQRRGLRVLGRQHEATDAFAAARVARRAGFDNLSLDLIFGWPGQTTQEWQSDLETVLDWGDATPNHLSLYSLIVEPGTPMADAVKRGILTVVEDDETAEMYEASMDLLGERDWRHYEVANWAARSPLDRVGSPPVFASRHNSLYWRNGEYVAVGAGAHGHRAGVRTMNHLLPRTYIEAIEAGKSVASNQERLAEKVQMGETMMVGLRLLEEGVGADEFRVRHGMELDDVFGDTIHQLAAQKLITCEDGRVRLTRQGLMFANDVCARFL